MGDLGINYVISTLKNSFDELGEDKLFLRRFYCTGIFHVPVPVVDNKLSLRIYT